MNFDYDCLTTYEYMYFQFYAIQIVFCEIFNKLIW